MVDATAPGPTPLAQVVATSAAVAATSSRTAKRDAIAALLAGLDPAEVVPVVGFLVGEPRQGRIGVGWRTLAAAEVQPAPSPTLTVAEVDAVLDELATLTGPGSAGRRRALLGDLLSRATAEEARFLVVLLGRELRQGALAGVMADAVARAAGVPGPVVRRAAMLGGDLGLVARIALTEGVDGLGAIGLEVGRPIQPMLASTAAGVAEAVEAMGHAVVDWKLDGIRIQAHRRGDEVLVVTRNLNDITARLPEVVEVVRSLPADRLVLDGEALVVDEAGWPVPFQDTASRISAEELRTQAVRPWFFDLLHRDGTDLVDEALIGRRMALAEVAAGWTVPGIVTDDPEAAAQVLDDALAAGHEGVVVKAASSPYEAGRRGKAWRKVKPVHTLDLVVLAAEWGHGRRRGWLSNLHLGARDDHGPGDPDRGDGFVMVGKTFKGLTDELLAWQTTELLARRTSADPGARPEGTDPADTDADLSGEESRGGPHGVVHVRPELVVEIALDGVQRSTRYAGGVALRFARVVRYRPDKSPDQADTVTAVGALSSPT